MSTSQLALLVGQHLAQRARHQAAAGRSRRAAPAPRGGGRGSGPRAAPRPTARSRSAPARAPAPTARQAEAVVEDAGVDARPPARSARLAAPRRRRPRPPGRPRRRALRPAFRASTASPGFSAPRAAAPGARPTPPREPASRAPAARPRRVLPCPPEGGSRISIRGNFGDRGLVGLLDHRHAGAAGADCGLGLLDRGRAFGLGANHSG